jgi:hypothetical protein
MIDATRESGPVTGCREPVRAQQGQRDPLGLRVGPVEQYAVAARDHESWSGSGSWTRVNKRGDSERLETVATTQQGCFLFRCSL